jgi:hypothetical protein
MDKGFINIGMTGLANFLSHVTGRIAQIKISVAGFGNYFFSFFRGAAKQKDG